MAGEENNTTQLPIRNKHVSFNVGESSIGAQAGPSEASSSSEPPVAPAQGTVLEIPALGEHQEPPSEVSQHDQQSSWALRHRDLSAIEYSKSLLLEGDTLVVIHYPSDRDLYDPAGFLVSKKNHHVHSEKLLATGSQVFQKLLGERAQERARKRAGYAPPNSLPTGVKYILDLTPPDEGDDAVDLISNLSCSPGIRLWAKTALLFGVATGHVDGQDESMRLPQYPIDEQPLPTCEVEEGEEEEEKTELKHPSSSELANIPEYCPIRHRAGIERLLRLIEGRDPKLDSAPKILTLAVLAKYFDCSKVVAGYIESWIVTEPNNKFIEILPEEAFKIGLDLKSKMIIEPAFAILVSEGAFLAAARTQQFFRPRKDNTTQFGRPKGDINEDELNRIEAAADDFQSRIHGVVAGLMDPSMSWIQDLPEFGKFSKIKEVTQFDTQVQQAIDNLVKKLGHYVCGEILAVEMQSLSPAQNFSANTNRGFEKYLDFYVGNFEDLYDTFSPDERYLTRFYWDMLSNLKWDSTKQLPVFYPTKTSWNMRREVAAAKGFEEVSPRDLMDAQDYLRNIVRDTVAESSLYESSDYPKTPTSETERTPTRKTILDDYWDFDDDSDSDKDPSLRPSVDAGPGPAISTSANTLEENLKPFKPLFASTPSAWVTTGKGWGGMSELIAAKDSDLPHFSLNAFMTQVHSHIASVCRSMLKDPYFGGTSFVDTLVCMSREELKYLPLWAGGNEDGTGGVFEKPIPPAEFGVAPNGPGPAFHTGLSVFSQASSIVEVNEDDQMTEVGTVNTSIAVDNGMSGHVDRRAIMSDFGSIASFIHVSESEGKGKEKEAEVKHEGREKNLAGEAYESMDTESVDTYDFKLSDIDSSSTVSREVDEDNDDDFMMVSDDDDDIELL